MRSLATIMLCALGVSPAFAQLRYEQFDVRFALVTSPSGVNAAGTIVGLYWDAANVGHGFLRHPDGTYTRIDYPGATFTNATAINARGVIVGRWTDSAGINHGYVLTPQGTFTQIDPPAPCVLSPKATVIHGLNDVGDLAGRCFDASAKELGWVWRHDGSFHALDDSAFQTTDAWDITNRGEVVGDYTDAGGFVHGYTWTPGTGFVTLDFPGRQTGVRAENERGDISGIYADDDFNLHGFVLTASGFETVDFPGNTVNAGTLAIGNSGLIVGAFVDADGAEHGFIADK
jgi:hypothetical protein